MNTNLVGSVGDGSLRVVEASWGLILLLMLIGALIGSAALTAHEIKYEPKGRKSNGWYFDLLNNFIMGIGATALVPFILATISSTLFAQMDTSIEARFKFAGFCVLAAFASRRLFVTLPQKVFESLNNVTEKTEQNGDRIEQVVEAVAKKTAKPPPEFSDEAKRMLQSSPIGAYDPKTIAVIRALLNPRWPTSRSLGGIAFDSGLTFPETQKCLHGLQQSGDVRMVTPERTRRTKDSWWALTPEGRRKCETAFGQGGGDFALEETGLQ